MRWVAMVMATMIAGAGCIVRPEPPMPVSHESPDPPCYYVPPRPGCNHRGTPPEADARAMAWFDAKKSPNSPELDAYIAQNMPGIQCCYSNGLRRNRDLEGRIIARWTIDASGDVSGYWTLQSTLASQAVMDCMGDVICGSRFPQIGWPDVLWSFVFEND